MLSEGVLGPRRELVPRLDVVCALFRFLRGRLRLVFAAQERGQVLVAPYIASDAKGSEAVTYIVFEWTWCDLFLPRRLDGILIMLLAA
jgi:hypothetical protein